MLREVRDSVEDWEKMRAQALEIVDELTTAPPPLDARQIDLGRAFLKWLADDHFAFLGYREYRLEREGDDEILRAVPGTGLGILRADQDQSKAFAKLPEAAKAKAREKTLLVLSKANSRATVHRPAYLDYVGVKTFDENGEVSGERRFLGLLSSAAYTESITRIPLLREKAAEVLARIGVEPRSHAGKSLMDTLETYPRDEIFHTPAEELAEVTQGVLQTVGRRQLRVFVRRETYGRYVSVLCYLPRDRYNTAVRERFSQILLDRFDGESIEFNVKMSESTTARVHFVVHPPARRRDPRRRRPRPRADVHRRVPLVARRLHHRNRLRVRRGPRLAARPPLRRLVPRGLQGGLLGHDGRARRRSARGHRERARDRHLALLAARRGPRRGTAQGVPRGLAALALAGAADAHVDGRRGARRAALRARRPRPADASSTSSACSTHPASPTRCAACSRTPSARCGTATTRSTASTPWCSPRG